MLAYIGIQARIFLFLKWDNNNNNKLLTAQSHEQLMALDQSWDETRFLELLISMSAYIGIQARIFFVFLN